MHIYIDVHMRGLYMLLFMLSIDNEKLVEELCIQLNVFDIE